MTRGASLSLLHARVGVVGHVEWVDFARVPRLPRAGEIVHARDHWAEAAGGGAVAVVQMVKLAGEATFFTALADDEAGRRTAAQLAGQGVALEAATRARAQPRAFTHLAADGERTITVLGDGVVARGDDNLDWDLLEAFDGVYFTGGDVAALRAARRARVLVATARPAGVLVDAGVRLDVLVRSGNDEGEALDVAALDPAPRTIVTTLGDRGGRWEGEAGSGSWEATALPGPRIDAYGAGDSFAAGLTTGLAAGLPLADAVRLGARCGAANLTGRGPYGNQLDLRGPRSRG